ncbi:hypothetical protein O1611_g4788 [Lasiodiplodia mahajangana]|uniref:Uncharacterized protein n=1 Tax=Lasiodiplodia mahajangana TaxID=1108764 RepID=A0ACC2JN49_9PEZI|nr:hypothetical protein O1611_g4788 [Lasiodiplodia mahajangana]
MDGVSPPTWEPDLDIDLDSIDSEQGITRTHLDPGDFIASGLSRRHTLPFSSVPPTPLGSRPTSPDGQRVVKDGDDSDQGQTSPTLSQTFVSDSNLDPVSDSETDSAQSGIVIAELNKLVGLEAVKDYFKELGLYIDHSKRSKVDFTEERFHAIFQGNPGTGKTTVAKLYAEFLHSKRVLNSSYVNETSGGKLAAQGPRTAIQIFEKEEGGVLFVDEAYQLVAPQSGDLGKQVLDVILTEMEKHSERWVVIFAGYKKDFEPFFAHNEGLSSRIPLLLDFGDFNNDQLREIMHSLFQKRFKKQETPYTIERHIKDNINGGIKDNVYILSAIHRISQGRGRHGFGNARAVQNYFQRICQRQASRVGQLQNPSIKQRLHFTKEDILGPRPINVEKQSKEWAKLKLLIGLKEVKESVRVMFQVLETNYKRELNGIKPHAYSLNRVFVGSPGTGKTTVAKLYGRILADLGFLSKGDVVVKSPADFIGDAVGKSESNTAAILASTIGKVLIIDEAYMLDPGDSTSTRDSFKTAVLDSIVAEVQGNPGDDRCVILIGYEDKMVSLFHNGNPGLSGRFMADIPFRFVDYNNKELRQILELDLKDRNIEYQPDALSSAVGMLSRYKTSPNFSNARAVKTLVSEAVLRNQERKMINNPDSQGFDVLEAQDFDPWINKSAASSRTPVSYRKDLSSQVSDSVIEQLENFFPSSQVLGHMNRGKPRLNTRRAFIFSGQPGTGKLELAIYMGRVFRDLGLLATDQVVQCSAVSFIGQAVGKTVPKTQDQLKRGLGKVLIIQDLHRLSRGGFSDEALDELTSFLGINSGKMAVILTGPKEPLNDLLRGRPALSTFFQDRITFDNLSPRECTVLLAQYINNTEPGGETPFSASDAARDQFQKAMWILTRVDQWANSVSVWHLATLMVRIADNDQRQRTVREPAREHKWILNEEMAMEGFKIMFNNLRLAGGKLVEPTGESITVGGVVSDPLAEAAKPEAVASEVELEEAAVPERKEYAKATVHPQQEQAASRATIEAKATIKASVHTDARQQEEKLRRLHAEALESQLKEFETDSPCPICGEVDCPYMKEERRRRQVA